MTVEALGAADAGEVVEVLAEAFHDYPVMRFVLRDSARYDADLRRLVHLFASARVLRREPMLGVRSAQGGLLGVAIMTLPASGPPPEAFLALREETWGHLGAAARQRYDAFGTAAGTLTRTDPHHHINMIGVRPAAQGQGHARALLDAAHAVAAGDEGSTGVSLSTELAGNLPLYQRFGYQVEGHVRVDEALESWTLFRPSHHGDGHD